MRWCLRGRMTCQSCRKTTQRGSPKYVCDHLWIWLVKVPKMIRQKTKHSQGYSCSRTSAGWGEGECPRAPNSCHIGRGPLPAWLSPLAPGQQTSWDGRHPGLLLTSHMASGRLRLPCGLSLPFCSVGRMGISRNNG